MVNKTTPNKTTAAPPKGATQKTQQVAVRKETSMAESDIATTSLHAMPDFMKEYAGLGTENIGREDMQTPRLKLISSVNKELQSYNELRPGMFFHDASESILSGPIRVVPLYIDKRYILWRPRDDGGGILARADDAVHWSPPNTSFTVKLDRKDGGHTITWKTADTVAASRLAEWGTMNPDDSQSQPAATEMYNVVFAFPDNPELEPAVFTFQRGSIKAGRAFNTKVKTIRAPIFSQIHVLNSVVDTNNRNQDYYVPELKAQSLIADEEVFNQYRMYWESMSKSGLTVKDLESAQEDTAVAEAEAPKDAGGKSKF